MAILRDAAADEYIAYVRDADRFARARRAAYIDALFGASAVVLFNETHQGVDGPGRMLLGCYSTRLLGSAWVPVTLRPDLPAFLLEPGEVYGVEVLAREGLLEQAERAGCLGRLTGADLLPHGGGYAFPSTGDAPVRVDDAGGSGARRFCFGDGAWFEHVRDLPFTYRGEEVVRRLVQLGAGRVATSLDLVQRLEG
ncbi:MAG: hypothetical protein MUF54_09420, partial [Polyangiaceae bacterium]|nr:hypothetical protein [Polyangiaceae bacterium]